MTNFYYLIDLVVTIVQTGWYIGGSFFKLTDCVYIRLGIDSKLNSSFHIFCV